MKIPIAMTIYHLDSQATRGRCWRMMDAGVSDRTKLRAMRMMKSNTHRIRLAIMKGMMEQQKRLHEA